MIPYIYCPFCCTMLTARRIPALDPMTGNEGPERRVCSACGFIQWGNSKPTASAIVIDESGRILLTKRGIEPFKGMWDIPGGFLEAGEHPEVGVQRELREETGVAVRVVRLIGVYMDTYASPHARKSYGATDPPAEDTLNFYYECRILSGTLNADDDAEDLAWFTPDNLPAPLAFENATNAMRDFLNLTASPVVGVHAVEGIEK